MYVIIQSNSFGDEGYNHLSFGIANSRNYRRLNDTIESINYGNLVEDVRLSFYLILE